MGGGIMSDDKMNPDKKLKRSRNDYSSRAILDTKLLEERVLGWRNQIIDESLGVVKPSVSELVCALLWKLPVSLSKKDMESFIREHITPRRYHQWALDVIRSSSGPHSLADVQNKISQVMKFLANDPVKKSLRKAPKIEEKSPLKNEIQT